MSSWVHLSSPFLAFPAAQPFHNTASLLPVPFPGAEFFAPAFPARCVVLAGNWEHIRRISELYSGGLSTYRNSAVTGVEGSTVQGWCMATGQPAGMRGVTQQAARVCTNTAANAPF